MFANIIIKELYHELIVHKNKALVVDFCFVIKQLFQLIINNSWIYEPSYFCTNIIKRVNRKVNAGLKSICDALGWRKITTYNARHTFATRLRDEGVPIEQIQKLLGHSSILTTQTYLGSLSTDILDKTKSILESLDSE